MLGFISIIGHLWMGLFQPDWTQVRTGDLIFIEALPSSLHQAVADTSAERWLTSLRISHIALFDRNESGLFVIDASPDRGVHRWSLEDFRIRMGKAHYWIGYLRNSLREDGYGAVWRARSLVGSDYEASFAWSSHRYYCSKLIYAAFVDPYTEANHFVPSLMDFSLGDSKIKDFWTHYFSDLGMKVPSGEWGISPLSIFFQSQGKLLKQVTRF